MSGFETTEDAEIKIVGSKWFPLVPHGMVGIIAVETDSQQWKTFIGFLPAPTPRGTPTHERIVSMLAHGQELTRQEAQGFFPNCDPDLYLS